MNKKIVVPIVVIVVMAVLAAAIFFAPALLDAVLRMHGMR